MPRALAALALALLVAAPVLAQPALTPWPMFQHDAQRTGKSTASGPSSHAVKIKWTWKGTDWIKTQAAVGSDGTVYVGNAKYPLCALDPARTSAEPPLWCTTGGGYVNASSPAVGNPFGAGAAAAETVYIGDRANKLWAYGSPAGVPRWFYKVPLDGDVRSSPLIAADGTVYAACGCSIAANDPEIFVGRLLAFAASPALRSNGSAVPKWVVELPYVRNSSPAAQVVQFPAGSPPAPVSRLRLYLGTEDGRLVAVDDFGPGQGAVAWTLPLAARNNHASPSIGPDGTIYLGTSGGLFAVRDMGDHGAVVPGFPFTDNGAPGDFDTAAAISDGTVFASRFYSSKRTLFAVAATDSATATPGTALWRRGPQAASTSSKNSQTPSAVVGANGVVYAAFGPWVYAFDPAGATPAAPLWQLKLAQHAISLAVGDGVLYVAARDSKLYAIVDQ
jgi:hypothetical protein